MHQMLRGSYNIVLSVIHLQGEGRGIHACSSWMYQKHDLIGEHWLFKSLQIMMQIKLVEKKTRVIHLSKRSIPLTGPLSKKSFHLGPVCNILVMQHSLVVYCGISHESLVFSPYKHEPSGTILCHTIKYRGRHD